MEKKNFLGIYIKKDAASVVCIEQEESEPSIKGAFSVHLEERQEPNMPVLANLISDKISEKGFQYSEAALALDCSMFIQHKIHSDFTDLRQIAQTIRFDAEETLATDISHFAVAFGINSSSETGSELSIFTVEKDLLADIISALQSNKIDPINIEPDTYCLERFLLERMNISENINTLLAVFSSHNGYLIPTGPSETIKRIPSRAFLLDPHKDKMHMLQREILMTIALLQTDGIDSVKVFDSKNSLQPHLLAENLPVPVEPVKLPEMISSGQASYDTEEDLTELSIAAGAVLSILKKTDTINFRSDFLPYQGKQQKLEKATRFLSISCTILFFVLGVFLQTKWFQVNKPVKEWQAGFNTAFFTIMSKKPDKQSKPTSQLRRQLNRIKNEKSGQFGGMGSESLSARMTRILIAFNKCAAQINLNIDSINLTTKTIIISGSTSNRRNTLKLRNALEENGLTITKDSLEEKGGRDNFRVTIEIK